MMRALWGFLCVWPLRTCGTSVPAGSPRAAWEQIQRLGEENLPSAAALQANYLRLSQAERERLERMKQADGPGLKAIVLRFSG